jgi:chromosome segregation ATPase
MLSDDLIVPPTPGDSILDAEHGITTASLQNRITELKRECRRLENVYQTVNDEFQKLETAYRSLEKHYFAVEGEWKRLEDYIRSRERPS